MKLRTLLIVVATLAALSAAVFVARRPSPPPVADARVGQPIVAQTVIEKAAKLRLSDQGKTVTLARGADGKWRVETYFDFPADFNKLATFIGSLTEAKLDRLVTSNAERIARLEFKDTKIEFLDATDKALWSVTLGKNAETGGGRYVRFGDEPKAFLAGLNAWLDTESKNWANSELLALKADDIAKIEIPFAEGGPVTVSRAKKEDAWTTDKTPAGQRVKSDRISTLLSSLGTQRFTDTTAPDDANAAAAKASQRAFRLTTFDQKTVSISLGRKPEEKKPKPPAPATEAKADAAAPGADATKAGEPKPAEPEFETVPAGPVFVAISHSDAAAPINALMQKRAFQIGDHVFTGLPGKADELFEPLPAVPSPAPTVVPSPVPAGTPPANVGDAKKS